MELEKKKDEKKNLNDDLVVFMRKRSGTEVPRYTAKLKTYVKFQHKRHKAAASKRHTDQYGKKKSGNDIKDDNCDMRDPQKDDERVVRRRSGEKTMQKKIRSPSSRSVSLEPGDSCGRRRRRRSCGRRRRRRRRSCGRRRRRRRSRRRRRRRSCRRRRSRRRRRRSCRRRRKSCRRRRRRC